MLLAEEIAEEYPVHGKSVLTPSGMKRVKTVYKTIPLPVWVLCTTGHTLRCSGHHLVKLLGYCERIQNLHPGEWVDTENGYEKVISVAQTGEVEEMYDMTVDTESGLFYSSGICSHNSTTFAARQLINGSLFPGYKSMYVVPFPDHMKTYARRFQEMEQAFRGNMGKQNVYNKVYDSGSAVDIIYCLTTADKSRGKTEDEVLIDEAQNMDPDIIPELLYVQTMSKTPSTIYAGTALSVDTLLEEKWSESSQGMWCVRAGDGAHWLNMYDRETLLKVCDNPQGPTCPYTGKKLNVTDGCYVHGNQQALAAGDIGIHVPQCIIPDIAYDPVQWGKVYRRIKRDDFKKVLQECFGIAVAEGSREISENDLIRLCVLTDTKEQLMAKCRSGYYRLIVSGCDWGGSDYNQAIKSKTSYTVHCIIGVAPDGGIDILHWRRHSGMNYPEIAQIIIQEHNAWGAQAIASDFGVGMAYNMELRNSIPFDKHFIMGYVGPMSAPLAEPKGQHMPNQLSLNRTEALTNVFKDIKSPVLKIRCRNWDDMAPFLTDFLNMYRLPIEMPGGASTFKYVRSSTKADDALHAFTFAYVLAKFYLDEPLVRDEALARRLRDVLYSSAAAANSELARSVFGVPNYVVSG